VIRTITPSLFNIPATVAKHGNRLVLVNARFGIPEPETAEFDLVQVPIRWLFGATRYLESLGGLIHSAMGKGTSSGGSPLSSR
jgi:hypothetical protein